MNSISAEGQTALLQKIWDLSTYGYSLFLRGSVARQNSTHAPWDIDVYLVLRASENDCCTCYERIVAMLSLSNTLPPLDLSVMSLASLISDETHLLKRILLFEDGLLVRGLDVRLELTRPPYNRDTARRLHVICNDIARRKLAELKAGISRSDAADCLIARIAAKAVLRMAASLAMRDSAIFLRNPADCAAWLNKHQPALGPLAKMALTTIEHGTPSPLSSIFGPLSALADAMHDAIQ